MRDDPDLRLMRPTPNTTAPCTFCSATVEKIVGDKFPKEVRDAIELRLAATENALAMDGASVSEVFPGDLEAEARAILKSR